MLIKSTIGTDPEVAFVSNNTVIPASIVVDKYLEINSFDKNITIGKGLYKVGKKEINALDHNNKPIEVHQLQSLINKVPSFVVDNVAIEFNTQPHCDRHDLVSEISAGMGVLKSFITSLKTWKNLDLLFHPIAYVNPNSLPVEALVFGCDPEFSIYSKKQQQVVSKDPTLRTFGGHIHIAIHSINDKILNHSERIRWVAKNFHSFTTLLDRIIGIIVTAMVFSDAETIRRTLYGKAGKIRIQPYGGIEYRVPSNFFLLDPGLLDFVFFWAQFALSIYFTPHVLEKIESLVSINDIVQTINTGDKDTAFSIFEYSFKIIKNDELGEYLPDQLLEYVEQVYKNGGVYNVFDPTMTLSRWE